MNVSMKATLTSSRTGGLPLIRICWTVISRSKKRCRDRCYRLCDFFTFFLDTFGIRSSGHQPVSRSVTCRLYSACSRYCCRLSLPAWSAGGIGTLFATYRLSVSKNYELEYAILSGDGPWHRYLIDLLLVSPLVLILALGALFNLTREKKLEWFCVVFVAASYLIMCNIKYGMNLRYANMWDLPLRFLAFSQLVRISSF